jgi:rSAM/selenodomain-associated transferase 1
MSTLSDTVIQLFAKQPIEGEVKTRLIPQIGKHNATAVYRHCLQYNLTLTTQTPFDIQIWLNRINEDEIFSKQSCRLQKGKDLGEKMFNALNTGLRQYSKTILIGSDCLDLTQEILEEVDGKLSDNELVIIPALDGGYVLIAASQQIAPEIFSGISWSTDSVLQQTLTKCMKHKIKTFILDPLRDIDHAEDLQHYPELARYLN